MQPVPRTRAYCQCLPRVRGAMQPVATDGGTLLMSAARRKKKLFCRTTTMMMVRSRLQLSRPKRQASAVMFWVEWGKVSQLGR